MKGNDNYLMFLHKFPRTKWVTIVEQQNTFLTAFNAFNHNSPWKQYTRFLSNILNERAFGCKLAFAQHRSRIFHFFSIFFSFWHRNDVEKKKVAIKAYFNQLMGSAAPAHWSKYSTPNFERLFPVTFPYLLSFFQKLLTLLK